MRLELRFANIRLDLVSYVLYDGESRLLATRGQIGMLLYLIENRERPVPVSELHAKMTGRMWEGYDSAGFTNLVAVQLHRLRVLLGPIGRQTLVTHKGEGIRFHGEVTVAAADLPQGSVIERDGRIIHRL